jgi:hypothetical protein
VSTPVPSVGRIVHYQSHAGPTRDDGTRAYDSQCQAAVVTAVQAPDETGSVVNLAVFNDTVPEVRFDLQIPEDNTNHVSGTWHWPEVV